MAHLPDEIVQNIGEYLDNKSLHALGMANKRMEMSLVEQRRVAKMADRDVYYAHNQTGFERVLENIQGLPPRLQSAPLSALIKIVDRLYEESNDAPVVRGFETLLTAIKLLPEKQQRPPLEAFAGKLVGALDSDLKRDRFAGTTLQSDWLDRHIDLFVAGQESEFSESKLAEKSKEIFKGFRELSRQSPSFIFEIKCWRAHGVSQSGVRLNIVDLPPDENWQWDVMVNDDHHRHIETLGKYIQGWQDVIANDDLQKFAAIFQKRKENKGSPLYYYKCLLDVIDKGAIKICTLLLRTHAVVRGVFDFDSKGGACLMRAVSKGNADIVALMLEAGFDVNAKNSQGENALMAAVERDDQGMVALLLAAGANPDTQDAKGKSARMLGPSGSAHHALSLQTN